ncbi:MAG TPA: hypothetical protein VFX16_21345 [Pseudonocardiaceae bacterium]|nr:hypothetical protein [Pseudonocardiaceae bacterium]
MADPIMTAIAVALAGKATEALAVGGRAAWSALVQLVRARVADSPEATEALAAAASGADDGAEVPRLARQLEALAGTDPVFSAEIRRLWAQASTAASADRGGVVNQISGTVHGTVVQAGEIHGGIRFDNPTPPRD